MKRRVALEFTMVGLDGDRPQFTIGIVSAMLGLSDQTLRLYEKHGLVKPARVGGERTYSKGDVQWLMCLRHLIHAEKVSVAGVRRLLEFAPCWEHVACPPEVRVRCAAPRKYARPCWELTQRFCFRPVPHCETCGVFAVGRAGRVGTGSGAAPQAEVSTTG
jgi:MerR family transcriptional regulator/heat shock protein HspR